ncbi:UNVERIFIED_ORG: enoyl-CoA hydratase/carnithine racemase [Paenarthrobacter nicotinovorans]
MPMIEDHTLGTIRLETSPSSVATITIDRPRKLNALSLELLAELEACLQAVEKSDARVLVLRTAGDRAFCVGADIGQFSAFSPIQMWNSWIKEGHKVFRQLAVLRQPTIAVIDGAALGGGLELALACDFRIASTTAKLGLPEVSIGTIPGWGGTERLTAFVGEARAKQLILAGRQIRAETALQWGLVTETAEATSLEEAVDDLVADILRGAPVAQQTAKQLVRAAAQGVDSAILEAIASGFTTNTRDFHTGMNSFRDKTTPTFTGH